MIRGRAALGVMETQLSRHPFFVGETYTIADIALYAYTHGAHEVHDAVSRGAAWIERVASEPRYVPLTQRPGAAGAAAA